MTQQRLFRLAVDVMHFGMSYAPGAGWHLSVAARRGDESWEDAYRADYSRLTTAELLDVLASEAESLL